VQDTVALTTHETQVLYRSQFITLIHGIILQVKNQYL